MLPIVRSPIRIVHLCAYVCVCVCVCVRTEEEEKDGRTVRVLVWHGPYAHTGELFIPTGRRLPLRRLPDPIVRPIFGTADRTYTFVFSSFLLVLRFFFFSESPSPPSYRSFYGSIFISFFFFWFWFWFWFSFWGGGEDWGIFFFSRSFLFLVFLLLGGFSFDGFFLWTLFFLRRIKHSMLDLIAILFFWEDVSNFLQFFLSPEIQKNF